MKDIGNLEKDIEQHLVHLKAVLSEQEILLLAEGGGNYLVDKGNRMLPVYRQYSLWVWHQIYRLNQAYVSTGPVLVGTNQTILRIFDDFDTSPY